MNPLLKRGATGRDWNAASADARIDFCAFCFLTVTETAGIDRERLLAWLNEFFNCDDKRVLETELTTMVMLSLALDTCAATHCEESRTTR